MSLWRGSGVVGYNVQTAVDTENHLIVAHEVTNVGSDRSQLANTALAAKEALQVEKLDAVADRGYFSGEEIKDYKRVAQIWVKDEPLVRHYASAENALKALKALESEGKTVRVVYAQDRNSGIKLLGAQAWFVRSEAGEVSAFLLKEQAEAWAKANGGKVLDYPAARAAVLAR